MGMPKPMQSPIQEPSTIKFSEPVDPTPPRASSPTNLPTIIVSTRL